MLKRFMILVVLLSLFKTYSQNTYKPFDLKNVIWSVSLNNFTPGQNSWSANVGYKICNDTVIINGLVYRSIYSNFNGVLSGSPPFNYINSGYGLYGWLRQDSVLKRTYLRGPFGNVDSLLMDYNLNVGDTIKRGFYYHATFSGTTSCNPNWVIKKITNINIGGGMIAKVFYTDTTYANSPHFIEGAGHSYGVFRNSYSCCYSNGEKYCNIFEQNWSSLGGPGTSTSCILNIGITEFEKEKGEISVFPNPGTGSFSISSSDLFTELEVFDVYGKLIYSENIVATHTFPFKNALLSSGYYSLRVNFQNKHTINTKIIVTN